MEFECSQETPARRWRDSSRFAEIPTIQLRAATTAPPPSCRFFCFSTYSSSARRDPAFASKPETDALASTTTTLKSGSGAIMSLTRFPRFCPPSLLTRRPKQNSNPSATNDSNIHHASPICPCGVLLIDDSWRCPRYSSVSAFQDGTAPPRMPRNSFQLICAGPPVFETRTGRRPWLVAA